MTGRYVGRRLVVACVQVATLVALLFGLVLLMPGDAADVQSSDAATADQIEASRHVLGLDIHPLTRFAAWGVRVLHGDLGRSLSTGRPVGEVISGPFLLTACLALITTAILAPLVTVAGFAAALRPGSWRDRAISAVSIVGDSVPDFVLAILLVAWLSVQWRLLPATFLGVDPAEVLTHPAYLVLPVFVIVARVSAPLVRLVRAGVVTVMAEPYVRQAQRLGVGRIRLLVAHVAPNALAPAMQELGRTGDGLLSGVLIVEAIFVVPGMGSTLVTAIGNRDEPVVLAVVLVTGAVALLVNLGIDLAGRAMVPRSREFE